MRYYREVPPSYLEKLVMPRHPILLGDYEQGVPLPDYEYKTELYKRFQYNFESLKHRYQDPYMVHDDHGVFRVKVELPPPPKVKIPPKERKLLKDLRKLAEHPSTPLNERKSAFDKMRRVKVRLNAKIKYEIDDDFLSIDRVELCLDNIQILCGGDCGLAMCGLPGAIRHDLFIYGQKSETVEKLVWQAQDAADWYLKVPRLLSIDGNYQPVSKDFFTKESRR